MGKDSFEKGLEHLSHGHNDRAIECFRNGLDRMPSGTHLYLYLGTAQWLNGDCDGAVESWGSGMRCPSIDGGLMFANLLWFAAAIDGSAFRIKQATSDIVAARQRTRFGVTEYASIGHYLAGSSNDAAARSKIAKRRSKVSTYRVEFYIGVKHFSKGDAQGYLERMRYCSAVDDPALHDLPEFYLATYESRKKRPATKSAGKITNRKVPPQNFPLQRGKFYSNLAVCGATPKDVVRLLQSAGRRAIVLPGEAEKSVIFDQECERDRKARVSVPRTLSGNLKCTVLALSVHDDDLLEYELYVEGEHQSSFSSSPGYFEDKPAGTPRAEVSDCAEKLARAFQLEKGSEGKLARLLKRRFASEADRYTRLVSILGIPGDSIGLTYQIINAASPFPAGFCRVRSAQKSKQ